MPLHDVIFIRLQIGNAQPLFDLDFSSVLFPALMDLDEILKAIFLVISPQREKPAESRTAGMYGAPSPAVQKRTGFPLCVHLQIREYHSVCHIQLDLSLFQQCLKTFPYALLYPPYIHGIKDNGTAHAPAALRAPLTVMAVRLYHITGRIQSSV